MQECERVGVKLLRALYEERREILRNIDKYLKVIRESVLEKDPNAKVVLFGSFVRGNFRPDSDIDVLIILDCSATPQARGASQLNNG